MANIEFDDETPEPLREAIEKLVDAVIDVAGANAAMGDGFDHMITPGNARALRAEISWLQLVFASVVAAIFGDGTSA